MIKIVANCQWNSVFKNGFWEQNLIPSSFVICALAFNKCILLSPFYFLFYADNVCVCVCVCVCFASIPVIPNRVSFENLWHFWCYWHLWEEKLRAAVHIMKVKPCLRLSEPKTEFCFLGRQVFLHHFWLHCIFRNTTTREIEGRTYFVLFETLPEVFCYRLNYVSPKFTYWSLKLLLLF